MRQTNDSRFRVLKLDELKHVHGGIESTTTTTAATAEITVTSDAALAAKHDTAKNTISNIR